MAEAFAAYIAQVLVPELQDRSLHGLQADDVSQEDVAEDLRATNCLPEISQGIKFKDSIKQTQSAAR